MKTRLYSLNIVAINKWVKKGFLEKVVPKICCKFTGEHPCRSATSIKLQSNFIKITLRHGCSHVNFLNIFRTPFSKNTSRGTLLNSHIHAKYNTAMRDILNMKASSTHKKLADSIKAYQGSMLEL